MASKASIFTLGGYRPFLLQDKYGNVLWEQFSQGPESMRPWFLIPGKENYDLMEKICSKMDSEAEGLQTLEIEWEGQTLKINVEYHLAIDGKLVEMTTGLSMFAILVKLVPLRMTNIAIQFLSFNLDGAYCTNCPVSQEDAHKIEVVREGFEDYWTVQKLIEFYESLKKNPDGSIKITHKGSFV